MIKGWLEKIILNINQAISASPGGLRRYFSNTGWLLGGQALSLAVSFFVGAWLARSLGPQDYGFFSYSLSFAGLFSMLASLGIDGILSRDLIKFPQRRPSLLGSGLVIKLGGGLLAWLSATAAAIYFIPSGLGQIIVSLIALGYLLQSLNIIDIFFRSQVESKFSVRAQSLAILLASAVKIYVVAYGYSLSWLAAAYSLEILLFGLILVGSYRARRLPEPWVFEGKTARYLLLSSWPLLFSGVASFFLLRIDQVMIGHYLTTEAVGLYAAGVKLSEVWYFLPGIIIASVFPALVNGQTSDPGVYHKRLRYLYWLLGGIALTISVIISLAARPVIYWLFGEQFMLSYQSASIYAWSMVGWFLFSVWWYKLMTENRLQLIFFSSLLLLAVNVLLNIWLIPLYGISGASVATLISYSLILVFIIYSSVHENTAGNN